ncbi:MAG TPA: hypothetical protein VFR29_05770 [Steroidobacteraceae bacterium]|nr:hypothetical protein [Steroidobacteraceae bacterium]
MTARGTTGVSPALLELLRSEMREIAGGVQVIAVSLATGNWAAVHDAAASIRASYIMEKSLTAEQAEELGRALPEPFKVLDAEFHARADKLAQSAAGRFPGLAPTPAQDHHH